MDFGEEIGVKKSSAQITDHVRFESIYEQDRLIPVLPDSTLSMESAALEKIRQSYACILGNRYRMVRIKLFCFL